MNVTPDFKEIVRHFREDRHVLDPLLLSGTKGKAKNIPEFRRKALAVLNNVLELENALSEVSKLYNSSKFSTAYSLENSLRRDESDLQFQKAVNSCADLISNLKKQSTSPSKGLNDGRHATIAFIEDRLKQLSKEYNEQRFQYLRRRSDFEKLSRFSAHDLKKESEQPRKLSLAARDSSREMSDLDGLRNRRSKMPDDDSNTKVIPSYIEEISTNENEEPELELENQQLYNEFSSVLEDVKSIETRVSKVAELQSFFAENVLLQDADIHRIADVVVGSSENIKEGNEQIRKAMQNNAGSRIIILFTLIILGLSILFLDWYND